ncbi:aminotransferase class V-fold PLP-dependent enzyme [Rhizobium tibeticum]|uniref:aminotransferase class V-fold PLP-dependent enzyme n=1 Tax=Rhizobium tibeticum TaxID=501024 RepID=UPI000930ABAB
MLVAWTNPGNAGSPNLAGERAAWTIAAGRQSVANLIGASPAEITFTSGTTEANNLAIVGAARRDEPNRNRIIVAWIQHLAREPIPIPLFFGHRQELPTAGEY